MSTVVNWVQDINGNFEVSSEQHLLQIMNKGTLYTDSGTTPTDYWSSNYVQTVDIDLADHHANIETIGTRGPQHLPFEGIYDGQEFRISNWSYSDSATITASCNWYVGLFGDVENNGKIQNIRMDGVCTIDGFRDGAGMVAGNYNHSSSTIYNIECNLSPGSYIRGGGNNVGGVVGWCQGSLVDGITLRGSLELSLIDTARGSSTYPTRVGGIIGVTVDESYNNIRNLATFPSGIIGNTHVGGIVGNNIRHQSFTNVMNYMKGDVSGSIVGGIFGICGALSGGTVQNAVNSMTGNLNGIDECGGIMGRTASTFLSVTDVANYMTGNITSTLGGGIVGNMDKVIPITNSVNAMNGSVDNSVSGNTTTSSSSVYVDTSFGLVASGNVHATSTLPTGWITDSTFTDLPYFDISRTDSHGTVYNWDFVFGNLSGKPTYSTYTHLSLHIGNVSAPLYTIMDLDNTNTTKYLAFSNIGTETLFMDDSITYYESDAVIVYDLAGLVVQISSKSALTLSPSAINVNVDIETIVGAIELKFTHQETGGPEILSYSGDVKSSINITPLNPSTEYTIRLYADYGSGLSFLESKTVTTTENTAENYDKEHFLSEGTSYDLSTLDESSRGNISGVMNDLFSTGDEIQIKIGSRVVNDVYFVKRGDSANLKEANSMMLPFDQDSGSSQTVSLQLSDDITTVNVTFDESDNSISVESVKYNTGDNFILDGKKVTVLEY